MDGYLGEQQLDSLVGTPYEDFNASLWAVEYISRYGGIDGTHHKQWVLDQVVRILLGTPVMVSVARWENGQTEYRWQTGEITNQYRAWRFDEDQAGWDEGVAP